MKKVKLTRVNPINRVKKPVQKPGRAGLFLRNLKYTLIDVIKNPKRYKMQLGIFWVSVLLAVYIVFILCICFVERTHYDIGLYDNSTVIPRFLKFPTEKINVSLELDWKDGVVELTEEETLVKLRAKVVPEFLERVGFLWSSSDENIASVDETGTVAAKAPGDVEITVQLNGEPYQRSAKLKVIQPITGLFMTTSNVTLYKGEAGKYLKVKIFPEDATESVLKWESSDTSVARVDSAGYVKPIGLGMTEVVASTEDGRHTCKAFVTVVNKTVNVERVNIETGDAEVEAGKTLALVASVSPSNAKNKTLIWSSENDQVATVTQSGRVKGLSEGTTVITVESVNGIKSSVNVTVTAPKELHGFDLDENEEVNDGIEYTAYSMTLPMIAQLQMGLYPPPQIWRDGGPVNATEMEVIEYMNPANYCDSVYKYQFLDLSMSNDVSADTLNEYLEGKGTLEGMGEVFKEAAEEYNVSEVYLVAHACLETGNGTSQLARGIEVDGQVVYNMFGIGAFDGVAESAGSRKAFNEGWTSVEAAIRGGARWISKFYINCEDVKQNTLYKMLWNPDNPGVHQYATDVGWAVKQADSISDIFADFPDAKLYFDIPVYSGQTAIEAEELEY